MSEADDYKNEGPARPMTRVVIDRATWYRGLGGAGSSLLTMMDKQCCLGFAAEALGYERRCLIQMADPAELCIVIGKAKISRN